MSGRLPSDVLVSAMLRRTNDAGGMGMVLARGDAQAGGILVIASERGAPESLLERGIGPEGQSAVIESTPPADLHDYWQRRRQRDPDLWIIELNVAGVKRLVVETAGSN